MTPQQDADLLRACSDFQNAHAELDWLLAVDSDPNDEQKVLRLHQRWYDACVKVISLPAASSEGRHAKAEMLLSVLDVVLGPDEGDRELHEALATSLAQDC